MLFYWMMFLIPASIALGEPVRGSKRHLSLSLRVLFLSLFIIMAFRETGGDYSTYLELYNRLNGESLATAVTTTEPIYGFFNWLSAHLGLGIYGVNALCSLIFLYCLYRLSQEEPLPFFLVTIAIPYFIIVGGMGYVRQGVAAALIGLAVLQMGRGCLAWFLIDVIIAAGFHRSALVFMALPVFVESKESKIHIHILTRVALISVAILAFHFALEEHTDLYQQHYIRSGYVSDGAFLRSIVHFAAGIVFFWSARTWRQRFDDFAIWKPFALLALLSAPLSLVWSTPVDRLALYLFPFQLLTFARLPYIWSNTSSEVPAPKVIVLCGYALYFHVWLYYGWASWELWIPYRCLFAQFHPAILQVIHV